MECCHVVIIIGFSGRNNETSSLKSHIRNKVITFRLLFLLHISGARCLSHVDQRYPVTEVTDYHIRGVRPHGRLGGPRMWSGHFGGMSCPC